MDTESFNAHLAHNIENARVNAGISKNSLANEAHIPRASLHRKLAGVTPLTVDELRRVTAVCGVSFQDVWPEVKA